MNAPFFITGLPRTRSAWLANLFTTDKTACHHEAVVGCGGVNHDFFTRMKDSRHEAVGASGSDLLFCHERIVKELTPSTWVLIDRNPQEAYESTLRFFNGKFPVTEASWKIICDKLETLYHVLDPMRVKYEDLNDAGTLQAVWSHCVPHIAFDQDRATRLQDFIINPRLNMETGIAAATAVAVENQKLVWEANRRADDAAQLTRIAKEQEAD